MRLPFLILVLSATLSVARPAAAHDSWFQVMRPGPAPLLNLGTGQRYPQHETAIAPEYMARQGCRPADTPGDEQAMRPQGYDDGHALRLQVPDAARSCWVQLVPLDVVVANNLVDKYLHEIQAGKDTWEAWRLLRSQGLPWRERYTKNARIDLGADQADRGPVPLAMDLVHLAGGRLQVLRDGQPLPGQPVQLINGELPFGVWRRSDSAGLLNLGPLPPGTWLARAVDLRPREDKPGEWDSRFVTLAFDVR